MDDEKIARWWNEVGKSSCWNEAVCGFSFSEILELYPGYADSIRNVYRKARRMV